MEHLVTTVFTETDTLTTVIRGTDALTTVFAETDMLKKKKCVEGQTHEQQLLQRQTS